MSGTGSRQGDIARRNASSSKPASGRGAQRSTRAGKANR